MERSPPVNYREADQLKLNDKHFPLACSLQNQVVGVFGGVAEAGAEAEYLPREDLLGYLRSMEQLEVTPFDSVSSQMEAMGDPSTLAPQDAAILLWVGEAFRLWESHFPLEEQIASQVRKLKPLAAAVALLDPAFFQPDAHPVHKLLDTLQARAVGWQATLGRAGELLEQQTTKAVTDALAWFEDHATDLTEVCSNFLAAAERDQSRAQRMTQRTVETEMGKVKTAAAKREAARMINEVLAQYPAPREIGDFLKGPWYTSAQLLLLKFGADSDEWHHMSETTRKLLDSVQSLDDAPEDRRQYIFQVVTQLPKDMRRWLLSLHHDTEAVNDAMGLVEFVHLRILRDQAVDLEQLGSIETEPHLSLATHTLPADALNPLRVGDWLQIETSEGAMVRARLALMDEQEQLLLFSNLAGIKVMQLSFSEFHGMMNEQRVLRFPAGASFSICLAGAAGIDSTHKLDAFYADQGVEVSETAEELAEEEPTIVELDTTEPPPAAERPAPAAVSENTGETTEAALTEEFEAATEEELDVIEVELELPADVEETVSDAELDRLASAEESAESVEDEGAYAVDTLSEQEFAEFADGDITDYAADASDLPEQDEGRDNTSGFLTEMAKALGPTTTDAQTEDPPFNEPQANRDEADNNPGALEPDPDYTSEQKEPVPESVEPAPVESESSAAPQDVTDPSVEDDSSDSLDESAAAAEKDDRELQLPMGAWLGFHDGETPIMAKLAVHDPDEGTFIFVNRNGVKLRQINKSDLLKLIDSGLVDILQTSSNFKEEVDQAQRNLDS
ncbi:MAG: DUF1631 family protein [Pseudomonadota bacterium]